MDRLADRDCVNGQSGGYGTAARFTEALLVEEITTQAVAERLRYRLGLLIGPGRRWSLAEAAECTGIDVRTLQSYAAGVACPNLAKYYRLERLIGPELGVELALMLGWEPRHRRPEKIPRGVLRQLKTTIDNAAEALDELIEAPEQDTILLAASQRRDSRGRHFQIAEQAPERAALRIARQCQQSGSGFPD